MSSDCHITNIRVVLFIFVQVILFTVVPSLSAQEVLVNDLLMNDTLELKGLDKHQKSLETIVNYFTYESPKVTVSVYPTFGYEEVTGAEFGVMPVIRILPTDTVGASKYYRPTSIVPSISYTTKGQLEMELNMVAYTRNGWNFYSIMEYLETPSAFYGVGNNNPDFVPSAYTSTNFVAFGEIAKSVKDELFVGVRYDISNNKHSEISETGPLTSYVLGYDGGTAVGLGPIVKYDTRDDVLFPSTGNFFQAYALFYPKWMGSDYQFSRFTYDIRKYFSLETDKKILAVQTYGSFTTSGAPFYKMPILASKRDLRGVDHPFKYIDNHVWYTRAEYRQYLWWRFSGAVFTGIGNNFGPDGNSVFEHLKYVYGMGFRFRIVPDDKINFRADVGWGPGGERTVYMTVLETF